MDKILKFIANETQGECFTSFKYCYDNVASPAIEYEDRESNYINLKEYAEDEHNPKPRDMRHRAEFACRVRLFSSTFWMVPEGCIKLMTFNMIKKYSQ